MKGEWIEGRMLVGRVGWAGEWGSQKAMNGRKMKEKRENRDE